MDRLVEYPWAKWLNRWAQWVNPWLRPQARPQLRGYYWMVRQSECATDVMFRSPEALAEIYPGLCRHAVEQFAAPQGAAFFGAAHQLAFQRGSL